MTGIEALQAMKDGKRVRAITWAKDEYIYWSKLADTILDEKGNSSPAYKTVIEYLLDKDWEVYEDTLTLCELLGYTIKFNDRNYYVVPYVFSCIHLDRTTTSEVKLIPVTEISCPLSWMELPLNYKIPKNAILKTPADNGIAILDGE